MSLKRQKKHVWTVEEVSFLEQFYKEKGVKFCSKKLGLKPSQVKSKAQRAGLQSKPVRIWTQEKENIIRDNYTEKGSHFCADLCNLTTSQVRSKATELGIPAKKVEDKIDINYFITSFTKESVYILGMLYGDGFVDHKKVSLGLIKTDLVEVKSIFETVGKWSYFERQLPKRQLFATITTHSKSFNNHLVKYGYREKSFKSADKIIATLPRELVYLFYRGFFDADGCICIEKNYPRCTFAGDYKQDWSFITKLLDEIGITYLESRIISKSGHKSSRVSFKKCQKFMDYIYQDYEGIGLSRKFNKFQEMDCKNE